GTKVQTVLEAAETIGKSTGLVATSQITHATPASFASHVESRYMEMEIARQIANQEIEVLLGGGQRFFLTNDEAGNLVEQMTLDGYSYIDTEDELQALNTAETEKVLGLFAESGMPAAKDGRLPLSLMSQKAVEILDDDPDGFFIMIE
ncbi:MAG: alkaline phosphatase, partial [candidate division Zixibacteria bacterium]|nr:alkaline phosphatase [Gammaproteobacteria bacterium]NIR49508.1 alkaline phosphatase [candidate division KSB1 bacterium]NIV06658.1 alkaline phosphatase [candidate division Zixibacteria bacterium]NIS24944.1 alkaline phosphatase [candidate division KSB1 bacterium]NIT71864.1 alkaline phosphatase [candidate division KSB1 bacterium]